MSSVVSDYAPPDAPIEVLHRDADLLVAVKPEGLLSVPGKGAHLADCLLSRLVADDPAVLLVHRLDRDTSGVMVFARNQAAQRHLGLQFERRHMRKRYIALVAGQVAEVSGRLDAALKADWPNRPRQMVSPEGRRAVTDWERLAVVGDVTRLALRPETGRSHQLRVHCAALGHPIMGDPLYGVVPAERMMLHAETLGLRHPRGGAVLRFVATCPF